jgi:hypothetical protein
LGICSVPSTVLGKNKIVTAKDTSLKNVTWCYVLGRGTKLDKECHRQGDVQSMPLQRRICCPTVGNVVSRESLMWLQRAT